MTLSCLLIVRLTHYECLYVNFVGAEILPGNHMFLAGDSQTFQCDSLYYTPQWHFYSLTPDASPCGFDSSRLYPGISLCPSASRISVTYLRPHSSNLTINRAQLCDAGTYTCGGQNPYDLTRTLSIIVGVLGMCYTRQARRKFIAPSKTPRTYLMPSLHRGEDCLDLSPILFTPPVRVSGVK